MGSYHRAGLPWEALRSKPDQTTTPCQKPRQCWGYGVLPPGRAPVGGLAIKTRSNNHTMPGAPSVLGLWGLTTGPGSHGRPCDQNPIKQSHHARSRGSAGFIGSYHRAGLPWEGLRSKPDQNITPCQKPRQCWGYRGLPPGRAPMGGLAVKPRSKNQNMPEAASVLGLWGLTTGQGPHKGPCNQNPVKTFLPPPMTRVRPIPQEGPIPVLWAWWDPSQGVSNSLACNKGVTAVFWVATIFQLLSLWRTRTCFIRVCRGGTGPLTDVVMAALSQGGKAL